MGQDVAAVDGLIAQNAVIEQVIGRAVMDAEQGRFLFGWRISGPGFAELDMGGQMREAYCRVDIPLRIEDRGAEFIKTEAAAARPAHRL